MLRRSYKDLPEFIILTVKLTLAIRSAGTTVPVSNEALLTGSYQ